MGVAIHLRRSTPPTLAAIESGKFAYFLQERESHHGVSGIETSEGPERVRKDESLAFLEPVNEESNSG